MRPVYDEGWEAFSMRSDICTAIFLSLLGVAAISAQTQAPNQTQPAPAGSMDGMDMSKPAANSNTNNSNPSKPMDMSHCMAMMKGGNDSLANIPPGTLRVTLAGKSNDWTADKLAALPHTTVTVHNEHTKADEAYSGVPLIALLTPVGVSDQPHGKYLRFYVEAVGSDGYETVYSIGELNPNVHDATVIVADSENGKPLTGDGPLKLVDTGDKHPARWVRNLVAIKVLPAE